MSKRKNVLFFGTIVLFCILNALDFSSINLKNVAYGIMGIVMWIMCIKDF